MEICERNELEVNILSPALWLVVLRIRLGFNNVFSQQVKLEQNVGKPSRVIHIRNIPSDVSEAEIIHLGLPFGRVTNVLVLKGKNQAFLEMGDEASATSMVIPTTFII